MGVTIGSGEGRWRVVVSDSAARPLEGRGGRRDLDLHRRRRWRRTHPGTRQSRHLPHLTTDQRDGRETGHLPGFVFFGPSFPFDLAPDLV